MVEQTFGSGKFLLPYPVGVIPRSNFYHAKMRNAFTRNVGQFLTAIRAVIYRVFVHWQSPKVRQRDMGHQDHTNKLGFYRAILL
jgi:hypothetical protein